MMDRMLPELTVFWIALAFSSLLLRTQYACFDQRKGCSCHQTTNQKRRIEQTQMRFLN